MHDPEAIALAVDLTEYGRRLSPRLHLRRAAAVRARSSTTTGSICEPSSATTSTRDRITSGGNWIRGSRRPGRGLPRRPRSWSTSCSFDGRDRRGDRRGGRASGGLSRVGPVLPAVSPSSASVPAEPERLRIADHGDLVNFTAALLESTARSCGTGPEASVPTEARRGLAAIRARCDRQ